MEEEEEKPNEAEREEKSGEPAIDPYDSRVVRDHETINQMLMQAKLSKEISFYISSFYF